jgi:hypothetical protein
MPGALAVASLVYIGLPEAVVPSAATLSPVLWLRHLVACVEGLMVRMWASLWMDHALGAYDDVVPSLVSIALLTPFAPPGSKRGQAHAIIALLCAQRIVTRLQVHLHSPLLASLWLAVLAAALIPCARDTFVFAAGLVLTDAFRRWLEAMTLVEALCAYLHVFVLLEWALRLARGGAHHYPLLCAPPRKKERRLRGGGDSLLLSMLLLDGGAPPSPAASSSPIFFVSLLLFRDG